MSKRLISYLLTFAMVFSMMPVQMFAAESYQTVTVDKTTVKVGEDVHITVTVPEIAETVGSIDVRLKFDTDKFEVKSRVAPPKLTYFDETYGEEDSVRPVYNTAEDANTKGVLTLNATQNENLLQVAGVKVIDAVLTAKQAGPVDFEFELFELAQTIGKDTVSVIEEGAILAPPAVEAYVSMTGEQTVAVAAPVKKGTPVTTVEGTNFAGTVTWSPEVGEVFAANTEYTANVTLTANEGYAFEGATPVVAGAEVSDVTVSADGKTMTFKAKFAATEDKSVVSIAVTTAPEKIVYIEGENFDATGMVVTATYDDDSTAPVTGYTVEGGEALAYGTEKVTISFGGKTVEQAVTVKHDMSAAVVEVNEVVYNGAAQKVTYTVKLNGTTLTANDYTVTGDEATAVGEHKLVVTGAGEYVGTVEQAWNIVPVTLNAGNLAVTEVKKVYDGETTVVPVVSVATGVVSGETVTVSYENASYDNANVGEGKEVTISGLTLGGEHAGNYVLNVTEIKVQNGVITAKNVAADKGAATQSIVVNDGNFAEPTFGDVTGEIKYTYNETEYAYEELVNVLKTLEKGAEGVITYAYTANGNYTGVITGSINFTVVDVVFTGVDEGVTVAADAVYGDNWSDIVKIDGKKITASLKDEVCADAVYTLVNEGVPTAGEQTYKVVFSGTINGAPYADVTVKTGTVIVAQREVTISGVEAADKEYDGTTVAVAAGEAVINNLLEGDIVTVKAGDAAFADKNVGENKEVKFSNFAIEGEDAKNYVLNEQPAAVKADITAKAVTVSGVEATDRVYNGEVSVELTGGTVEGVVEGDEVTVDLQNASAVMADANVGEKAVTVSGVAITGADAGNYVLSAQPEGVTVIITKADMADKADAQNVLINKPAAYSFDLSKVLADVLGAEITGAVLDSNDGVIDGDVTVEGLKINATAANIAEVGKTAVVKATVSSTNYNDFTVVLTITSIDKTPLEVTGVEMKKSSYTYGDTVGYKGTPVATLEGEKVEIPEWTYTWYQGDVALTEAPVNAGEYKLVVSVADSNEFYMGKMEIPFTIAKKTVKAPAEAGSVVYNGKDQIYGVKATENYTVEGGVQKNAGEYEVVIALTDVANTMWDNGTSDALKYTFVIEKATIKVTAVSTRIYLNKEVPAPTYKVTGLAEGEVLKTEPTVAYAVPVEEIDTSVVGQVDILVSGAEAPEGGNYNEIVYVNGVLNIKKYVPKVEEEVVEPEVPAFEDVAEDAYYADAVQWAVENEVTNGMTETTFAPDAICTRAQAVTFLWRAAGAPAPESDEMPFTDVAEGAYYYDAVLWAIEQGITNGTSETTFSPDMTVTRAHVVTFLWRMEGAEEASSENPFVDVEEGTYYYDAVLWAVENEITNGMSEDTFVPANGCTRGQIVTFIYRCMAE